ncbi:MAG: cysteine hydrolase [Peptococcaceae bacterium]|nr:cysteine hydrolase [Peptococcaceae bacterium]
MTRTALIIIDMQNDFCLPGAPFSVEAGMKTIPLIQKALIACRRHRLPIIHVIRQYRADGSDTDLTRYVPFKKADGALIPGTKGAEIVVELQPEPGEYVVVKWRWSAFFQTELDLLLRRLGVLQVVVAGVQTPNCIRATVWDALSLDYEAVVLTDATGANTEAIHQANLLDMQNVGTRLLTTDAFIQSLPDVPTANLQETIRAEIQARR